MSESDDLVAEMKKLGYDHADPDFEYWEFNEKELYKILALVEPVIRSKVIGECAKRVKKYREDFVGVTSDCGYNEFALKTGRVLEGVEETLNKLNGGLDR